MKKLIFILAFAILSFSLSAQWNDGGTFLYPFMNEKINMQTGTAIIWKDIPSSSSGQSKSFISSFQEQLNLYGKSSLSLTTGGNLNSFQIDGNGNIGIGTSANSLIDCVIDGGLTRFQSGSNSLDLVFDAAGPGVTSLHNSTDILTISSGNIDGAVVINSQLEIYPPLGPSDLRLKKDIVEIDHSLSILKSLRPVKYKYIDNDMAQHIGLIAQEVKEVLPEIVADLSMKGEDGETLMGVRYQELIPVLIKAIQEQQETIERQGAAIEQLQSLNKK